MSAEDSRRLDAWRPCPRLSRLPLEGQYCRLELLDPSAHGESLFNASMAPGVDERFRYLFDLPMDRESFEGWLKKASNMEDPMFYAVIDRATGRCEGRQAFLRITPEHGVIEIGNILWGPAIARSRVATEALYLFARHAFEDLGYRRFEWKCDSRNAPSRRAALRFGFEYEGILRQHMVIKGQSRDTAWFAMTDGDWPQLMRAYEDWLSPSNFDAQGQQKERLHARCDSDPSDMPRSSEQTV